MGELRIIARFQSTLPTRGSDELGARTPRDEVNFNPRSPRGGATSCNKPSRGARCNFNPRSPRGGATPCRTGGAGGQMDFNPRSPRGGATDIQYKRQRRIPISIHAPHEGERLGGSKSMGKKVKISIHAPHEGERRTSAHGASAHNSNFNPRSPRGGATAREPLRAVAYTDFNPRSPRGGATRRLKMHTRRMTNFNPRSPRGGATKALGIAPNTFRHFNPRSPRGGATPIPLQRGMLSVFISIHAPHEGERRIGLLNVGSFVTFQSTLPTRGSDIFFSLCVIIVYRFQSTLPTRGSDTRRRDT